MRIYIFKHAAMLNLMSQSFHLRNYLMMPWCVVVVVVVVVVLAVIVIVVDDVVNVVAVVDMQMHLWN